MFLLYLLNIFTSESVQVMLADTMTTGSAPISTAVPFFYVLLNFLIAWSSVFNIGCILPLLTSYL